MSDPRTRLSHGLVGGDADAALAALDGVQIVIRAGAGPTAAHAAAALLAQLRRLHAHVDLDGDAPLGPNPWQAPTLATLHAQLDTVAPAPAASPASTIVISAGSTGHADLWVGGDMWTAAVARTGHLPTGDGGPPYGALAAAGLACARVFRDVLRPAGLIGGPASGHLVWNLLDYRRRPAPTVASAIRGWPRAALCGVGSVGSSTAAALAFDDLAGLAAETIDGDSFDPDRNPYRYPASLGTESGPKARWVAGLLTNAGAEVQAHVEPVRTWVTSRPTPGFDGVVLSSVDSVDGRFQVADILARTTISAAVDGLALHVQREHLGDGHRCPFCEYVDSQTPLSQAGSDAVLLGIPEQRIIELLDDHGRLTADDLNLVVAAGRIAPTSVDGLVGHRLADLRPRVYAEATISPAPDRPPVNVSAPFVSWLAGVVSAAELAKTARGLPLIDRRIEVDLHGEPSDVTFDRPADDSGRCPCANAVRRRWMRRLWG